MVRHRTPDVSDHHHGKHLLARRREQSRPVLGTEVPGLHARHELLDVAALDEEVVFPGPVGLHVGDGEARAVVGAGFHFRRSDDAGAVDWLSSQYMKVESQGKEETYVWKS